MKKTILIITLLLAGTLSWLAAVQLQQTELAEKLLRLHVVAHSDSAYDQNMKILVRDAVLSVTDGLESIESVQEAIPEIRRAAEQCLADAGCHREICVTLAYEEFPLRQYQTFALPAGVYPALRVTIGAGNGQNWWCVVFPSLCLGASGEVEEMAVSAGFTEQEIRLITEDRYVLRFKTLELIQKLRVRLSELFPK